MPDLNDMVPYLKSDMIKDGDLIKFVNAGAIVEKMFKAPDGTEEMRDIFEIKVLLPDGNEKIYSPNFTSVKALREKYTSNTEEWVGKEAKVSLLSQNVKGTIRKVIYTNPV